MHVSVIKEVKKKKNLCGGQSTCNISVTVLVFRH